jgi:hypothetical protein
MDPDQMIYYFDEGDSLMRKKYINETVAFSKKMKNQPAMAESNSHT